MRTLSETPAGAGHRAVSLHRDCVLVILIAVLWNTAAHWGTAGRFLGMSPIAI